VISFSGIETRYRGYRFRSRAEARWAAFFDQLGMRWSYEPIDLHGYIPDFIVHLHAPLIVEVKGAALELEELRIETPKIECAEWPREALLVGAEPFGHETWGYVAGLLGERDESGGWWWDRAPLIDCPHCSTVSFTHESSAWACRRCGEWSKLAPVDTDVDALWAEAHNVTRWR
jgi:hypothetical protein